MQSICLDNIILVGLSGTGKSSVGERVALTLGWNLVDMDSDLEAQTGKSVPRMFSEDGEASFRRMEKELLERICQENGQVISTGGGVIIDEENRRLVLDRGLVVCLEASPETICQRLSEEGESGTERPLLSGSDPLERIRALKTERQGYYSIAHHTVNTESLTVDEVASAVVGLYRELAANDPGAANRGSD